MNNTIIYAAPRGDGPGVMWRNSILGTLAGLLIGMANLVVFRMLFDGWVPFGVGVVCISLIVGAVQGSLLRKYTRPAVAWLGVTSAGWLVAYALLGWPATFVEFQTTRNALTPCVIGVCSSLGQWLMLRRSVGRAFYWVWISVLCWYIVFWLLSV